KVTSPSVSTDVGSVAGSTAQAAGKAVQEAAEQQVKKAVDSGKLRGSGEAAKLVAEAEKQAASIRAEANSMAAKVKKEGYLQADSLVAKSQGPLQQAGAKPAGDQLCSDTDGKAGG